MHSYLVQMGRIDVFKGAFNDLMNFASELDLILVLVTGDEEFVNFFVSQESNRTLINDLHCVAVRLEKGTPLYNIFLSIYKQVCVTGVTLIGKNGLPLTTVDLRNYTSKEAFQQAVEEKATRFSGLTGSSAALFVQDEIRVNEIQEAEEEVSGDSYAGIDDTRVDTVSGSRSNEEFQDSNLGSLASYSDRVERHSLDVNRVRSDENSLEDSLFEEESFIGSEDNGNGSSSSENFKMTDGELLSENVNSENERSSISSCSGYEHQPPSNNLSNRVNYENPLPSTSSKCSNTNNQNTSSVNRDLASSNEVSLQVRTPNGTRHTEDFKKTDTLGCVKRRLEQKLKLRHFRIASPVKQSTGTSICNQFFEEEDYDRTLEELQLFPTAVLIIMPISSEPPFIMNGISRISSFFWYLVMPVLSIVNYFKSLVFGGARGSDGQTVGSSSTSYQPPPPPPTNGPRPNQMRRRRTNKEGGNVHTLRSTNGEDNDSNTYNGNSTQQMP